MKTPIFIKNIPIDEKRIGFIETVIARMSRRMHQTVSIVIPPHLISTYISGEVYNKEILNMMFFKGTINKALICFNKRPENSICIEIKLLNGREGFTKSVYIDTIRYAVDLNINTVDGSVLEVSTYSTIDNNEIAKVSKIWLSLLWTPHKSRCKINQVMIDDLEKSAEEFLVE